MTERSVDPPPTDLARRYARYLGGFGAAVAVGLAPFLGKIDLPGFSALLSLFPSDLQRNVIPLSAFLMGIVAVAVQFYAQETWSRETVRRHFKRCLIVLFGAFFALLIIYYVVVVPMPYEGSTKSIAVLTAFTPRLPGCCPDGVEGHVEDSVCIQRITLRPDAIKSCWGGGQIKLAGFALTLSYLLVTGSFGALIGFLSIQEEGNRRRQRRAARRRPRAAAPDPRPPVLPPPRPLRGASPRGGEPKAEPAFDVFLCHRSGDKPAVEKIALELRERGLEPWLDAWELRPGLPWQRALEAQIRTIPTAAVFVGPADRGPWQDLEIEAFLRQFVKRDCPVIPVILPGCEEVPKLPVFLEGMTWVDLRDAGRDPLAQLVWGITGEKPSN